MVEIPSNKICYKNIQYIPTYIDFINTICQSNRQWKVETDSQKKIADCDYATTTTTTIQLDIRATVLYYKIVLPLTC